MRTALDRLISLAGELLLPQWRVDDERLLEPFEKLGAELISLLRQKTGFFAFESALHVLPLGSSNDLVNLEFWNDPRSWRHEYGDLIVSPLLFFAQDAYGNQFCLDSGGVFLFHSEFAELERIADTLAGWAEVLMSDWRGWSGYDLAHQWQVENRPLQDGERLIPKIPDVIGGKYETANLYNGRIVDAMRFRGSLARQIATVPDGEPIRLKIV